MTTTEAMVALIQQIWRLFTEWKLPVINATPASFFFFLLIFPLIVSLFKSILTITADSLSSWGRNSGSRSYKK